MKTRLAIIGSTGIPAIYGGFETLSEQLVRNLVEELDITVYCSSKYYKKKPNNYLGAKLVYLSLNSNGKESVIYDLLAMLKAIFTTDILLVLGVSGGIFIPLIRILCFGKKIIVNIDGQEWKREKWGKFAKWFLKISEIIAVKFSHEIISDNSVIEKYVYKNYHKKSKLISYGGDHAKKIVLSEKTKQEFSFCNNKYAFSVCRIEPENNIHLILMAFESYADIDLVIVGNWEYSHYGKELKKKYNGFKHIHLLDPIYEQMLLDELRSNCFIYLHGHSAGGTNPSLVEAMYLGLPIIAFDVEYNKETTFHNAYFFKTSKELIEILSNTNEKEFIKIAVILKAIADKNYTWQNISKKYLNVIVSS